MFIEERNRLRYIFEVLSLRIGMAAHGSHKTGHRRNRGQLDSRSANWISSRLNELPHIRSGRFV